MGIARSHSTPITDFNTFKDKPEGSVIWESGNRKVLVVHLPNWLARDPITAPKVLAFQAVLGRTHIGTFISLEMAIGALMS